MASRVTVESAGNDRCDSVRLPPVGYQDDPIGYEQRLNAKLRPDIIRGTLAFAGLYQVTQRDAQTRGARTRFASSFVWAWTPAVR